MPASALTKRSWLICEDVTTLAPVKEALPAYQVPPVPEGVISTDCKGMPDMSQLPVKSEELNAMPEFL